MKKIIIALYLILISMGVAAQSKSTDFVSESKVFKFQEAKGLLVKIEKFPSEYLRDGYHNARFTPATITDVRSNKKMAFIEVWFSHDSGYSSIIDLDEVPSIVEALEYILDNEVNTKPSTDVSVFIISRDGITLGARFQNGKWEAIVLQSKYLSQPRMNYKISDLEAVIESLRNGANTLSDIQSQITVSP